MEQITILGSGTMGHSIALSAAWAELNVTMYGINEKDVDSGIEGINHKLDILIQNELISENDRQAIINRVTTSVSVEQAVKGATFVIEAAPENLQLKQDIYKKLDSLCDKKVILASNTSGLSPTDIAAKTLNPERVVITHFWNPGHLIPLVEVVRGKNTSDETVKRAMNLLYKMKKKPIEVKKDIPGFVGNRLQYALLREALYILEQGAASIEDIDAAVKYSIGRRLPITGPLLSADMGGLDVYHSICSYLCEDLSDEKRSPRLLEKFVEENKIGQKSGEGFYKWSVSFSEEMDKRREKELIDWLKKDDIFKELSVKV